MCMYMVLFCGANERNGTVSYLSVFVPALFAIIKLSLFAKSFSLSYLSFNV